MPPIDIIKNVTNRYNQKCVPVARFKQCQMKATYKFEIRVLLIIQCYCLLV